MTHFLFTLWDGAGALPPELSVARALVERGHRVSVLSDPTAEAASTSCPSPADRRSAPAGSPRAARSGGRATAR